MTLRFRATAACNIAGLERYRLNEYISNKTYPCAPFTGPGRPRIFVEHDLIGLWIFAQLIECHKYKAKDAGQVACEVVKVLRMHPEENEIIIHASVGGTLFTSPGSQHDPQKKALGEDLPMFMSNRIHIDNVRAIVRSAIELEQNTIGED